jgi:hypothetical protein
VKVADGVGVTEGVGVEVGGAGSEVGVSAERSFGLSCEGTTMTKRLKTITRTKMMAKVSPLIRSRVALRIGCRNLEDYTTRLSVDKGSMDWMDLSQAQLLSGYGLLVSRGREYCAIFSYSRVSSRVVHSVFRAV